MQTTILIDSTEPALSRSDRAAVECAIRIADGVGVAVCCPSGSDLAIRYAIAAGAKKLISLEDLATGLIVCGLGGLGFEGELTAARLARRHQSELVLDVLEFSITGNQVTVVRKLDRGEKEILEVPLPAVLVMSEAATTTQYVSRYRQQRVSTSPLEAEPQRAAQPAMEWSAIRPRTRTTELATKTGGGAQQRMFAAFGIDNVSIGKGSETDAILRDPDECAAQLIRYLSHHGFVHGLNIETRELLPSVNQAASGAVRSQSIRPRHSEQPPLLTTQTQGRDSSPKGRNRPRPVEFTQETIQAKLDRHPRSIEPCCAKPSSRELLAMDRYRRWPRPIDRVEPVKQRVPHPVLQPLTTLNSN